MWIEDTLREDSTVKDAFWNIGYWGVHLGRGTCVSDREFTD